MESKILFDLIKNHKYSNLISILKNDILIDVNICDDTNTYLIHYAIIFNQINIIALLINRNCKLDILDSDGRSILYIPIKFNYLEIFKLLINFSNITIGIPLLEIQDKYMNVPIHYCIMYNKYEYIDDILNMNININFKDSDGNTILNMIINKKNKDINLIKKIINCNININNTNNIGYSALHIAVNNNNIEICKLLINYSALIDIQSINEQYTPIFLSTINNNLEICKLLFDKKIDINNQDYLGNTILNYAIINKNKDLINIYYISSNVNILNISNQISINLYFESNYDMYNLDEYFFNEILKKSKLNIQNDKGITLWHNLTLYDIWESYEDILIKKKNNIFIKDHFDNTPYIIINNNYNNKLNKFIKLIANSYYNYINKYPDLNYDIKLDISNKKKCLDKITDLIKLNNISYPIIKKVYPILNNISNINFSTYTGNIIDIISGLIYINKKYDKSITTLTNNFIFNQKFEDFCKSIGIRNNEFNNFEILWYFQHFFIPTDFFIIVKDFINNKKKEYLIIPIGIDLSNGSHSNILLLTKSNSKLELERFEPHGKDFPSGFNYNPSLLDNKIILLFKEIIDDFENNFIYYSPSNYQLKIGFQILDNYESNTETNIGDPNGFCSAWCIWYIEMRILNINISRENLIKKLINNIREKNLGFRNIIRNFTKNITNIRDNILTGANLNINKWNQNNYTNNEYTDIINIINKEIDNLSNT